ncbi:unnamed protein product [Penicillium camemberti]|uniref:Str. FM013 n=1 Tax=Penicillium camemberti (strain FM 013) TaxID=1429867 RepID=A0A0G4PNW8_PENC3|nr:unnamed protein product [Penicillium camemberti]
MVPQQEATFMEFRTTCRCSTQPCRGSEPDCERPK